MRQIQKFTTASGTPIYQLTIEVFPKFFAHLYLIFAGEYRVLIDTGSGWGVSNEHLERVWPKLNRTQENLRG